MCRTDHIARRLSLVLGALLLVACPARAGIAFVSGSFTCTNNNTAATTLSLTLAASTAAGHAVVVASEIGSSTTSVSSITDSGGSSYAKRTSVVQTSGSVHLQGEIWSTSAGGSLASTSVTVNISASKIFNFCVAEYSGANAIGVTATNSGTSGNPTLSLTTEDNNDFLVAGIAAHGAAVLAASVGNFRGQSGSANSDSVGICDNTAATPSSVTCTVTNSQNGVWTAVGFDLRLSAACTPTGMLMGVERC